MTSQQIRNTIAANDRSIGQYWNEKRNLENQMNDLERLRNKFNNLQRDFESKQNIRRNRMASFSSKIIKNNIFENYYAGMNDLINSRLFGNAYDGLSEAKNRIWNEIQMLQQRIDKCVDNINYLNQRNEEWRSELIVALEREQLTGENG